MMKTAMRGVATTWAILLAACAGSSQPTTAAHADAGIEAGAPDAPVESGFGECTSAYAVSLLGTWQTIQMAGNPSGPVPVKVDYIFCGMESSGTFTYTEDGKDTPYAGCRRFANIAGTWVWPSTSDPLTITTTGGISGYEGCPNTGDNYSQPITKTDAYYAVTLTATRLTLAQQSAAPLSPVTFDRQ